MSQLLYSDGTNYNKRKTNMSTEALKKEFMEFKKQIAELKDKLNKTGEQFLVKNFKEVFNNHPKLEEVRWSAYTPYFNDGEPCEYSSDHLSPELAGAELEYNGEEYNQIEGEIKAFMEMFDDDLMYDMFGDHIEILVTQDGMAVEEYDHD